MNDWVVLDTETTGFSPKTDRLIEFGAAHFDPATGEFGDTLHIYVNPGIEVPASATAIHGIRTEQLVGQPEFSAVAEKIADFIRGKNVIAHSASFDVNFLNAEFKRSKLKDKVDTLASKVICTRRLARYGRPNTPADLNALCDAFGIDRTLRSMHGAMIDCWLLAQVYPHLAKLQAARDQVLSGLLPFTPGADLPQDLETLGRSYVMMSELVNRIKAEQERIRVVAQKLSGGKDLETADFSITFSPGKKTTEWAKIQERYLADVDLSEYQKTGESSMKIEAA
jgi:DNA polymerase III subunit epsilon